VKPLFAPYRLQSQGRFSQRRKEVAKIAKPAILAITISTPLGQVFQTTKTFTPKILSYNPFYSANDLQSRSSKQSLSRDF
jgi:hypothetical protein